jgi:hypothetical protein
VASKSGSGSVHLGPLPGRALLSSYAPDRIVLRAGQQVPGRQPKLLSKTDDVHVLLDFCLQRSDVK